MLTLLTLALLPCALAAPGPAPSALHIPLQRRAVDPQDHVARLPQIVDNIRLKYGFQPVNVNRKRSSASSPITDQQNDVSYSAVVSIGTPAQNFNLILDTGSSDLWVATNQCTTCSSSVPVFQTGESSSYKNGTSSAQITYGSGEVGGYVSQDAVSFCGFSMTQELLSVAATTSNLLSGSLSGIMGLGFQPISVLQTSPFWETLYTQNKLSSPVFSFYLERYVNQNPMNSAPGGTFTLGGTNSSLYQGNIEFIDMPSGSTPGFWLQQVSSITVQGKSISVSSSQGLAAIDTGTTLIGAPSSYVQEVWSNVPGSVALSGQYAGMYSFPCSTSVSVSISFGGTNWAISSADMNAGTFSGSGSSAMCFGAIFDTGSRAGSNGANSPTWLVGATFLKNVYSVFQANPPAVGFAQLASGLNTDASSGSNPASGSSSGTSATSHSAMLSLSLSVVVSLLTAFFITL